MYKIIQLNNDYFEKRDSERYARYKEEKDRAEKEYKENKDSVLKEYKKWCRKYYKKFNPSLLDNGTINLRRIKDLSYNEYISAKNQIIGFKKRLKNN